LEQARATAIQLEVSLNRERAGRAGDVTRLESKVADLNRIVAAQQLEILKLRGEPIGDEEVSDERADLNQEHP
jgi:acyl-coenzyme A thioesterase PaaI-like protein